MKRPTLFKKILLAMLLLSLAPLLVSSLILSLNLKRTAETLSQRISESADVQTSENLQERASQVAESVTHFLQECEADLLLAASLPSSPEVYRTFYDSRNGEIWYRSGMAEAPREEREWIPRYALLELIDRHGRQRFVLDEGKVLPQSKLRDVSRPADTLYKGEDYFARASRLKKGEIYVSHVTGFHLTKEEQLAGASDPESAFGGKGYRGVVRFATPLFDRSGAFDGVLVLALDHRHLMEFTQHILPGKERETVFPSYKSGNYAFMFDDEGWIITHPKFWDIRGVDGEGRLVPPYSSTTPADLVEKGRIPYNLDYAGFIHPNYPAVAAMVRRGRGGYVDITNVGGAKKIMAFAPILYDTGDYARNGVFGAVTIGFQADQFHEYARTGSGIIEKQLREHIRSSALIVFLTSVTVVFCAWLLSRGITRPLALLTLGARKLASGETAERVKIDSLDEIGELADDFNRMAGELEQRKNSLLDTLEKLRGSRKEIIKERNFKESILESISSCIFTLSRDGLLTSINATGRRFLGEKAVPGAHYGELFEGWGDMAGRIGAVLAGRKGYGREPFILGNAYYEIGFFPVGDGTERGITVTMRNETERERMREEMTRMDRLASLGKLSAGIAHEVRNPLTGISLLLDDLHDRSDIAPETRSMMVQALTEIERVERLIAALLNYSSPPRAEMRLGDLTRAAQDLLLLFRKECEQKGVTLVSNLEQVPPFPFDHEKIRQALLNLMKNALQALQKNGTLEVAVAHRGETAVITIRDTGQGIAEEDIPLLFEPFFTRKGAGTGLGLSITQRIVEEHHGTITVSSTKGEGTVFTVTLPMDAQAAAE